MQNDKGELRMKRLLNILIIVCVLLTASSLKAEKWPLSEREKQNFERAKESLETEEQKQALEKYMKRLESEDGMEVRMYRDFFSIKAIDMSSRPNIFADTGVLESTRVELNGDDAKKIGLDKNELTNYLKLRIKNTFTGIKLETVSSDADKYDKKHICTIFVSVWVVGTAYPIAHLIEYHFFNGDFNDIWNNKIMGCGSIDNVKTKVKSGIDTLTEDLAVLFFKVRGEL